MLYNPHVIQHFIDTLPNPGLILSGEVERIEMGDTIVDVNLAMAITTILGNEMMARLVPVIAAAGAEWQQSDEYLDWLGEAEFALAFVVETVGEPSLIFEVCRSLIMVHRLPLELEEMVFGNVIREICSPVLGEDALEMVFNPGQIFNHIHFS